MLLSGAAPAFRMDEAELFKASEKITLTLNFTLGVWTSSSGSSYAEKLYNEIVLPVQSLQWCSSALAKDTFAIEYPAIFKVKIGTATGSRSLFEIQYAYLQSVQPTYNAPWVNGMPMTCSLALTFKSLLPTYKQTFQPGGWRWL